MKKIVLILTLLAFIGCEKESVECNCGTIANDGIDGNCYWLEIRNDCSGNKKKFCFDQDVWMSAYPGSHFCVYNEDSW